MGTAARDQRAGHRGLGHRRGGTRRVRRGRRRELPTDASSSWPSSDHFGPMTQPGLIADLVPRAADEPPAVGPVPRSVTPPPYDEPPCSRCRPACRRPGRVVHAARWRSASPASRSCPSRPSPHTTKGTLVHRALELLLGPGRPSARRRRPAPRSSALARSSGTTRTSPASASTTERGRRSWPTPTAGRRLPRDGGPACVHPIGLELRLEAQVGDAHAGHHRPLELTRRRARRHRLQDRPGPGGQLGAAPPRRACTSTPSCASRCSAAGRRSSGSCTCATARSIEARPTERSVRFLPTRTEAVWRAVDRACETGDFKPRPGRLCATCAFQDWCPAFGGDPDRAASRRPCATAADRRAADATPSRPALPSPDVGPPAGADVRRPDVVARFDAVGRRRRSSSSAATRSPTRVFTTASRARRLRRRSGTLVRRPRRSTSDRPRRPAPGAGRALWRRDARRQPGPQAAVPAASARPSPATPATRCAARSTRLPERPRQRGRVRRRRC